jgi:uncharacterized protein (TIGR04562 family)
MDAELAASEALPGAEHNPHSAGGFRSVQVTVRKLIHLPEGALDTADHEATGRLDRSASFYFNYEIQLLDRASYEATHTGPASHGAYKQRQIATARRRVLGELASAP